MMDLDRVNAYMARVEESETKTFKPVSSKLKVGLDLGTAYIVPLPARSRRPRSCGTAWWWTTPGRARSSRT